MMEKGSLLRMLKFALFSASAGLIQIFAFTALNEWMKWSYWAAYLPALILSVVWNFTFNRRYTFRSDANVTRAMALVFLYYLVFTPLSTLGGSALANAGWNEYAVLGLTMAANFLTEYLFQRHVVYRGKIDTRAKAQ